MRRHFTSMMMLALAATASALIPEPANVYYSSIKDSSGRVFTSADTNVVVKLFRSEVLDLGFGTKQTNFVEVSQGRPSAAISGQPNLILLVPLDGPADGAFGARYWEKAARAGEILVARVYLSGVESASTATIPAVGARGAIQSMQITLGGGLDSDGDGMADEWEMRYFGTLDRNGLDDFDNDGFIDRLEFLRGLDPKVPNPLSITIERGGSSTAILTLEGPIGKALRMEWATTPSGPYVEVPTDRVTGSNPITLNLTGERYRFIRLRDE